MSARLFFYLAVVGLVLAAYVLRLHRLDAVPLRGDEAYSVVLWTATPFSEDWLKLWREEPAPAGAFTLYWAWNGLVGTSVFATRYLSLLGNVLGLAVMLALAKRLLGDWRLAGLVGVMWALHPFLLWHAQDARTYGVLSALTPLTFYWLLRGLDHTGVGVPTLWPYILLQTTAIYLYYLEPFWLAAQGVFVLVLYFRHPAVLRRAFTAWIVIGILAIPFFAQLYTLMFVSAYEGNATAADGSALFSWFVPTLLFGENHIPMWLGVIIAGLLLVGLWFVARRNKLTGVLLLSWLFVPVILLYGASFVSDFFRPRYVTTVIPALLISLVAIASLVRLRHRYVLPLLATVVFSVVALAEDYAYFYTDPPKAPDWPGLMTYLEARAAPDDVLIFGQPDPAIEYYYRGAGEVFIAPLGWPQPQTDAARLLDAHTGLYIMSSAQAAPAAQYLQANAQHIPGDTHPGVNHYRPWEVQPGEINHSLDLNYGDVARLRGYTLLPDAALLLYWEALAQVETEHSILLHLERSPDAPPAAVLDHGVANSVVSMRVWEPGTLYRDPVALPPDLPPGEYTLRVGIYETATGERLSVEALDEHDGYIPVGTITVE